MSVLDRLQMMLLQMKQFTVEGNSCSNLISADDNRTKAKNKQVLFKEGQKVLQQPIEERNEAFSSNGLSF